MNNSYYWQNYPYCYLEKAYIISKRIRKVKKDYFLSRDMLLSSKRSWQSIVFYTNTELNNYVFTIYIRLLQYRIGLYLINLFHFFRFMILDWFHCFSLDKNISRHKHYYRKKSATLSISTLATGGGFKKKINRKLVWIEATLNDLRMWKRHYLSIDEEKKNEYSLLETEISELVTATIAYESIGLLPRSITRTFSRFKTELTNQSSSLVLQEFRLAKYQALASLQYIGCLIFIPLAISTSSQKCLLEPWITNWWNSSQSQIFITSFQEEKALEKLQEIEELSWLDRIITNSSFEIQLQNSDSEIHQQTIELVKNYNEDSIQTILHLLTDIIYFIVLSGLFILGKERLVILNSWAQELFYSLSDTMKAFFILLVTDLCIGFHSPHGWEILISSCLEHFGFVHNKQVISCFVSTFPVILDTVFKYLIFRHLNRISPSIVATYHTMNE
uniref:Potassium/proton antiporter CemA n=1 Tax=Apopellia endiviifolia TaxID=304445 RepID=K4JWL0_9MARC|nr:chloroplast envelope membrane protein [Apopellia endiviifolia]AFU88861.1 chloroplast envelope membrane protein [Apopellia endiviifolia]WIA67744.1 chloroplast envelope membrane protein [Apopellia endiviifolia]WKW94953.1 chloroplast envelope membrane protein [Apopellia endiviifolia]